MSYHQSQTSCHVDSSMARNNLLKTFELHPSRQPELRYQGCRGQSTWRG